MKTRILIAGLAGVLVVAIVAVGVLAAADRDAANATDVSNNALVSATEQPQSQKVARGPKDIPPGLEKVLFIHYKKPRGKPPGTPGKKPPKPTEAKCYAFLKAGVKWDALPVDCVINSSLSAQVQGAMESAGDTWDAATGVDRFGQWTTAPDADFDDESSEVDGRNELSLGPYPNGNVIAVTVVWGYFSGPPSARRILEFDILFNNAFQWGDALDDDTVMDWQNIATHELGHGLGLGDVYESTCAEVTMYGYSDEGEIKKRDLDTADVTGLVELYGQ